MTSTDFETEARRRLSTRDPEDWPILAAALALGCPIWTEDTVSFRQKCAAAAKAIRQPVKPGFAETTRWSIPG